MNFRFNSLFLTSLLLALVAADIPPKPAAIKDHWGDQGDGTYVNPILPADYSDLDAIRVGDDFYAMSSTFQFSPGVVILHSKDLVNWKIAAHAVTDLTQISPEMNWDVMNRYGKGIWAGAIRYHDNRFYIYFGTPDEGIFETSATTVTGPWEPLHTVIKSHGWDDCCPFWDDDGQGYLVTTNFADGYKIHLFKLSKDNQQIIPDSDRVIHQSRGSEANKLYKINGLYYHYFSEPRGGEGRVIMMERAKTLDGPWEIHQINHVNKAIDKEPNQGGLIQLATGEWWFISHQGSGDWEGRAMVLLPITWIDGWPIIGKPGADNIGNMVWQSKKPIESTPDPTPDVPTFATTTLAPQWEWNYQPRADKWSLTERPGFLRLHAFAPLKPNDLLHAGNTLTQRCIRTAANSATLKLDISHMTPGQTAGLCHFAKTYAWAGIVQTGATRTITTSQNAPPKPISATTIYVRSTWGYDGISQFSYSLDDKTYTDIGAPYKLTWGNYRGDRVGVFTYSAAPEAGYIDVESFSLTYKSNH